MCVVDGHIHGSHPYQENLIIFVNYYSAGAAAFVPQGPTVLAGARTQAAWAGELNAA